MSPRTPTRLSGQARVKLKNGVTIEGWAVYDRGDVHVTGRVRTVSLTGVRHGPLVRRTLRMSRVHEILWRSEHPPAAPKAKPGYSRLQGRLC